MPAVPSLDLIVNIQDPQNAGLLALVDNQVSAGSVQVPQLVRNDGQQIRLRFVRPSTSGVRLFDDVDVSSATVRVAIGSADKTPSAGTFYLKVGSSLTSGSLSSGKRYLIVSYVSGDSFTNVGAGSNATGTVFTASGTTPTTWTNGSSLIEITADLAFDVSASYLQTALNATLAIANAGNVTVTLSSTGVYLIQFVTAGAKTLLGGDGTSLAPQSVVSISRIQTGTSSVKEIQLVRLVQNPYCFATPSTALPVAAAGVTQVQTGSASQPSIQRLTLDPAPYAGTFSFTIDGPNKTSGALVAGKTYKIATFVAGDSFTNVGAGSNATGVTFVATGTTPTTWTNGSTLKEVRSYTADYNISEEEMQTLVGSTDHVVTKSAGNSWTFQWLTNGAHDAIAANVTGLSVPIGVSGALSLSTYGLFQAFAATTAETLTLTLEVELQFSGEDPRTVLQVPIVIARDVIDLANLVPTAMPTSALVGSMLFVDAVNGDDASGARGNFGKPYLTLTAAKNAAQSGDVIVVRPGTYNEANLLKNGVNWDFHAGAIVNYTGTGAAGIFDDSSDGANGAVASTITGEGAFIFNPASLTNGARGVFYIANASSFVTFRASLLRNSHDASNCVYQKNGTIYGDVDLSDNTKGANIGWENGECHLRIKRMTFDHPSTSNLTAAIWTNCTSTPTGKFWIDVNQIVMASTAFFGNYGAVWVSDTNSSSTLR